MKKKIPVAAAVIVLLALLAVLILVSVRNSAPADGENPFQYTVTEERSGSMTVKLSGRFEANSWQAVSSSPSVAAVELLSSRRNQASFRVTPGNAGYTEVAFRMTPQSAEAEDFRLTIVFLVDLDRKITVCQEEQASGEEQRLAANQAVHSGSVGDCSYTLTVSGSRMDVLLQTEAAEVWKCFYQHGGIVEIGNPVTTRAAASMDSVTCFTVAALDAGQERLFFGRSGQEEALAVSVTVSEEGAITVEDCAAEDFTPVETETDEGRIAAEALLGQLALLDSFDARSFRTDTGLDAAGLHETAGMLLTIDGADWYCGIAPGLTAEDWYAVNAPEEMTRLDRQTGDTALIVGRVGDGVSVCWEAQGMAFCLNSQSAAGAEDAVSAAEQVLQTIS